jgi:hypothetical protein
MTSGAIPRALLCRGAHGDCRLIGTPSIVGNSTNVSLICDNNALNSLNTLTTAALT